MVGKKDAIAGRSMPASMRSEIFAIAISAPVLPAETTPAAWPSRTASMARRMLDCRPWRNATDGFMSFGTVSSVCRIVQRLASLWLFFSSGASRASSPNSRYWTSGKRLQAMLAPLMTICGASSPPMASRAIVRRALTMAVSALGCAGSR